MKIYIPVQQPLFALEEIVEFIVRATGRTSWGISSSSIYSLGFLILCASRNTFMIYLRFCSVAGQGSCLGSLVSGFVRELHVYELCSYRSSEERSPFLK